MREMPPQGGDGAVATAQLVEIVIDKETWDRASPEQQLERRVVLEDLLAEHRFEGALPARGRAVVTARPGRILIEVRSIDEATSEGGGAAIKDEIPVAELEKHLREYLKICVDMSSLEEGDASPRLEALDMAKRLVHNEAGTTVQRHLRSLKPDHATGRRLFTLILTLHFDTTRLVRPHHLDAAIRDRILRDHGDGRGA